MRIGWPSLKNVSKGIEQKGFVGSIRSHVLVYGFVVVQARMSFPGVQTASQWAAKFTDEAVVWDAEVSKFESKSDEVRKAIKRLAWGDGMGLGVVWGIPTSSERGLCRQQKRTGRCMDERLVRIVRTFMNISG